VIIKRIVPIARQKVQPALRRTSEPSWNARGLPPLFPTKDTRPDFNNAGIGVFIGISSPSDISDWFDRS
jgi:hypothetical protein